MKNIAIFIFFTSMFLFFFLKKSFERRRKYCKEEIYFHKNISFQLVPDGYHSYIFYFNVIDENSTLNFYNFKILVNGKELKPREVALVGYSKEKETRLSGMIINKDILAGDTIDLEYYIYSDFFKKVVRKKTKVSILDEDLNLCFI